MFGIGGWEFAIILLFAFLIFGPDKLPEIAKTIGHAIKRFKAAQEQMNDVIKTEVYDPASDKDDPFKKPLEKLSNLGADDAPVETFAQRKARYDKERAARKAAAAAATPASASAERPKPSADELYGTAPQAKSPRPRVPESAEPASSDEGGE